MGIAQQNEYQIGVNNDLGNLANNVDYNRIGEDLTWLELDGSTIKVSVGSFIESQGNLYLVETAAETPTGTPAAGAYLFFDEAVPGFVWSTTAGTFDPTRGGIYDASDRRQCRWQILSGSAWGILNPDTGKPYEDWEPKRWIALGQSITISSGQEGAITKLNSTDIAYVDSGNSQLRRYRLTGNSWSLVGSALSIPGLNEPDITALNETDVVVSDSGSIQMYRWGGSSWSAVGSSLGSLGATAITALNETDVAMSGSGIQAYRFDGSSWSAIGTSATLPSTVDTKGSTTLSQNTVVMCTVFDDFFAYQFDGSNWAQLGNALSFPIFTTPTVAAMNYRDVAFVDTNKLLKTFRFDGANWAQVGGELDIGSSTRPAMTALSGTDVALFDDSSNVLTTYWNQSQIITDRMRPYALSWV